MSRRAHERRHSRFWLYTPFILLLLVAIGWSVAWWVIRDRRPTSLDAWLGRRRRGRDGNGPARTVRSRGYPFRFELSCASLDLGRGR